MVEVPGAQSQGRRTENKDQKVRAVGERGGIGMKCPFPEFRDSFCKNNKGLHQQKSRWSGI